jgi:hypothetical protein
MFTFIGPFSPPWLPSLADFGVVEPADLAVVLLARRLRGR